MGLGFLGKEYPDGEVICRQGEVGDCMYIVQEGRAEVLREEGGTEVVVGEIGPGEVFGEMAIFDRQTRSATVRTRGKARIMTLDKRAFLRRVHDDPSLAYNLLERMSLRIRHLDQEMMRMKEGADRFTDALLNAEEEIARLKVAPPQATSGS